jgi:hypothetical protein
VRRLLPPRPFLDVIARRTLLLWAFARGVTWMGTEAVVDSASLVGPPVLSVAVTGVVLLVTRIEMGRKSERLFLANLGWSLGRLAALVAAECVALESVLRAGLG